MYSRVLILLPFLAVVWCHEPHVVIWCTGPAAAAAAPARAAALRTPGPAAAAAPAQAAPASTGRHGCYPLQTPEVFVGNKVNYILPGFPPLKDFIFEGPGKPQNEKVLGYMNMCALSWAQNFQYSAKDHFHCDIAFFWQEFFKTTEAQRYVNHGTQEMMDQLNFHWSKASAKDVIPCQLSELAEYCMFGDSLVSCVREHVSREVRMNTREQYTTYGGGNNLILDQQKAQSLYHTTQLSVDSDKWTSDFCKQMAEKGQCGRHLLEVPLLAKDILGRKENGRYAGCF
eukprot:GHVS01016359.1.p1 GENE.GHVS01016359.1~~GHVS01016359.1.p1  ORF type:complete len:285 (+),score=22.59 GHVS01016359.1:52-906(+)